MLRKQKGLCEREAIIIETPRQSERESFSAYLKDINDLVAKRNNETIEKIMSDMGFTKEFVIGHRGDFRVIEMCGVKHYWYKTTPLFTQWMQIDSSTYTYKFLIHQKGKVV